MNKKLVVVLLALGVVVGACGRSGRSAADSALAADLSLASQQHRDSLRLDSLERSRALAAPAPVRRTSSGEVVRRSSSGTASSSSGETVVKHTQRDAAIGAAAGAIIGATTSRDKVKGGVIGGVVGGVLGGVIGNNVDKTKKKP